MQILRACSIDLHPTSADMVELHATNEKKSFGIGGAGNIRMPVDALTSKTSILTFLRLQERDQRENPEGGEERGRSRSVELCSLARYRG